MSRGYGDADYDEDFPNQGEFWWANARRALKGKRGRKALVELREALLMLPEKRLVAGAVSTVALAAKAQEMPDTVPGLNGQRDNWAKREALEKCEAEGMGVCAIGAYLLRRRVKELGETPEQAMRALPSSADIEGYYLDETAALGKDAGLTYTLAYLLADRNDETYEACTPEERYQRFLSWIDRELAQSGATAASADAAKGVHSDGYPATEKGA